MVSERVPGRSGFARPNVLEVDLCAIKANARAVRRAVGAGITVFGAVKANAYGFGLPEVARSLLAGGVDGFTAADPADALRIRDDGIGAPILLYGGVIPSPETVGALIEHDLMCTVTDVQSAAAYAALATRPLSVFAKIDVGNERLGTYAESALGLVRAIREFPSLVLEGVYTHVHPASAPGYLAWQLGRFERLLTELERERCRIPIRMAESSVSLGTRSHPRFNAVDPGQLLYGLSPAARPEADAIPLRPALRSLRTKILQVKDVARAEYVAEAPVPIRPGARIGVLPIGRADGFDRVTDGSVLAGGGVAPIAGAPSLEHSRIDLTGLPGVRAGDDVVILGRQGEKEIRAQDVARARGLDMVDLALQVRPSVPRRYLCCGDRSSGTAGR